MKISTSRLKKNIDKQFIAEVITPLFLGGESPTSSELRTPSLKGVLRFWWRAINGNLAIEELRKKESEIFGSTDNKAAFQVQMTANNQSLKPSDSLPKGTLFTPRNKRFQMDIIRYLSFGLTGTSRHYFPPGTQLNIHFRFLDNHTAKEVLNAFHFLICFGGLGAKTRNGFGSLFVDEISNANDLSSLINNYHNPLAQYTAFSEHSNVLINPILRRGWVEALSDIGLIYKDARLTLERSHSYDRRLLIAKPIVQSRTNQNDRHSKPFFLHVNRLADGNYQSHILCLPYQYGKDNKELNDYIKAVDDVINYITKSMNIRKEE